MRRMENGSTMTIRHILFPFLLSLGIAACGPNHFVKKGDLHLEGHRPDAAARFYQQALDKDPSHASALRGMAGAHLARQEPVRAIVPAQRATSAGDPLAQELLIRALLTIGRAKDALRTTRKAHEADPERAVIRQLLVESLIANKKLDEAADTADEKLIDLATPEARGMHTWALYRADRMDAAVAIATEAVAIAPDDADIQSLAAMVFMKSERQADYNRAHKMARALLPASPQEALQDAAWLSEQGDTEGAIRALATLLGAYPHQGKVSAQLGLLFAEQGAWADAVRALEMALTSDPYRGASSVSGVIQMASGDNVVEGRRRGEVILIAQRLGDSYQAIGRHDKAAQSWQVGLNENPKPTASGFLQVANAWERAGNVDQMGQAAQAASELEPANPAAHHVLARAFDKSNNVEWAIRHAQKSWSLDPSQADVAILLGSLYESRGERRVARELYRDALRRHPSSTLIYAAFERVGGTRRR